MAHPQMQCLHHHGVLPRGIMHIMTVPGRLDSGPGVCWTMSMVAALRIELGLRQGCCAPWSPAASREQVEVEVQVVVAGKPTLVSGGGATCSEDRAR